MIASPENPPLQRIGIVVNAQKREAILVARQAVAMLAGRIGTLIARRSIAALLEGPVVGADDEDVMAADAVLVFGGDGTVLSTSRVCAPLGTPMLGINLGRFGFLNDVMPEALESSIERLLDGSYTIEERLMLCGEIVRDGEVAQTSCALNEVVISHGSFLRVLHLTMSINGKYVTTYAADGVIVATPTGSTAYSLSAGGPLVHPSLSPILITPICPHTLTTRALLVPQDHALTVTVEEAELDGVRVTLDGQLELPFQPGDMARISRAPYCARLICLDGGVDFYDKLQSKLRWGERLTY